MLTYNPHRNILWSILFAPADEGFLCVSSASTFKTPERRRRIMHQQYAKRILPRLIILCVLAWALLTPVPRSHVGASFTTCNACDENFYLCYTVQGGNYTTCHQAYDNCLGTCTFDSTGGGGSGGGCGRGRTQCDLACDQSKRDCIDTGGETCGADFEACKLSCCSQ
jgi:hypothetical protein